ncbi:hypothetical protein HY570_03515 [Candidatus Micrarchaeota archaeon]|nr:hypothetical protein [Candidatus Micrarchaeota archaeon]
MIVESYLTGIYPRSDELIKATRDFERKRITQEDLENAFKRDVTSLVQLQIEANLSYVYEGLFKWQDIYRPFVENVPGLNVGALSRHFDNNSFYKQPIVVNEINSGDLSFLNRYFYLNHLPKDKDWKAILPGPYTFAQLAENKFYKNKHELLIAISTLLSNAVEYLNELGFTYFQFSEPYLAYSHNNSKFSKDDLKAAYEIATKTPNIKYSLQVFFGDISSRLGDLLDLPVHGIGIDFTETNVANLKDYSFTKELCAGIIDGRNSLVENPENIANLVKKIKEVTNAKTIYISPNCELEFVPQAIANQKVRAIKKAADLLKGE